MLVNLHLVARTHNVDKTMVKLFVLVFLDSLELHQHADQNVSLALNVLKTKLAITKNVLTRVQEPVVSMQIVKSEITIPFVLALQDTLAILS